MKTKFFFACILCCLFPLLLPAAPEGSGKAAFDRQTTRLAARLQLRTFQEDFFRTFPAEAEKMLLSDMKNRPRVHREKKRSFVLAGQLVEKEAEKEFLAGARASLSPYAANLPEKELLQLLAAGREERKKCFHAFFPPLYECIRVQALEEQRRAMLPVILPDGAAVEKNSDEALKKEIMRRFSEQADQKLLWEENERFFQQQLLPGIIAAAREQQKVQRSMLKEIDFPIQSWEPKEIEARLTQTLEHALSLRYPDPLWRYPLFPATRAEISRRAGRAVHEKVMGNLPAVPAPENYGEKVRKSPAAHRRAAESLAKEEEAWTPCAVAFAMDKARLPEKMRSSVAQDAEVKQRAQAEFARRIAPQMKKERSRFAGEQAKTQWPALFGDWQPEMEAVERFAADREKNLPPVDGRPDASALLEETDAVFDGVLREKLTRETLRLDEQRKCVTLVYGEVLRAVGEIRDRERQSFLTRWFGIGGNLSLAAVSRQYEKIVAEKSSSPLFPSVKEEIEVRSRAILQQLAKLDEEKKTPEKPEPPKEEKKEEPPSWTIFLREENGVLSLSWEGFSCRESDPRKCAAMLGKEIERRMKEAKVSSAKLLLVISGDETRYRSIALFREELHALSGITEARDAWEAR